MSRMSCVSSQGLLVFCQSSGSKLLNWTSPTPQTHPQRAVTIWLYLLEGFFLSFLLRGSSTGSATKPPILIMNKNKPQLFWSGVCEISEGGHQKSGESDSWSSSWSGPLIRSEWQENMGPNRYPPTPSTLLVAPIWLLTRLTYSSPFRTLNETWDTHKGTKINVFLQLQSLMSLLLLSPPHCLSALHVLLLSFSTGCHKPVGCIQGFQNLMDSSLTPIKIS